MQDSGSLILESKSDSRRDCQSKSQIALPLSFDHFVTDSQERKKRDQEAREMAQWIRVLSGPTWGPKSKPQHQSKSWTWLHELGTPTLPGKHRQILGIHCQPTELNRRALVQWDTISRVQRRESASVLVSAMHTYTTNTRTLSHHTHTHISYSLLNKRVKKNRTLASHNKQSLEGKLWAGWSHWLMYWL